ncbi:MAG TPA: hypothetical protein VFI65_15405 [Streptosporangiaceae bacterium]|nr:hypothetical protein [Streptosporangiaceae bacterium]
MAPVTARPALRATSSLPTGTRDLASGNPDVALLPALGSALAEVDPVHKLYGGPVNLLRLVELAAADFAADGITGEVAVVGGALDARAERTYADRRTALVQALADHGLTGYGRTGLGVWVPVAEEAAAVQQLLERGWAISPGERFRFHALPGIRVTTTALEPADARLLAAAIADVARPARATYAG